MSHNKSLTMTYPFSVLQNAYVNYYYTSQSGFHTKWDIPISITIEYCYPNIFVAYRLLQVPD